MNKNFTLPLFIFFTAFFISFSLFQPEKDKIPDKISGAYEALNFWSLQRVYPFNDFHDEKYFREFEKFKSKRSLNKYNGTSWETIGPHNTAGRTLCIEFNPHNPNTIYAGSASGGLWRSYTGGFGAAAWEYIPTGYPVLGVSSIAISPEDSNTIYIATGEVYNYNAAGTGAAYRNTRGTYGIGILKTTDGGLTWTKSLDWSYNQQRGVWVVKINPLNTNTIWAGTTIGTFKSTDAGETWQQVHNVVMVTDLIINAADTNIVITGCGNFESTGYGIYRTSNNGNSWTKIISSLPSTFAGKIMLGAYEQNPNIIYASIGNGFSGPDGATWLSRSTNAGETFTIVTDEDYSQHQGWFSHDVAIHPEDSSIIIAVGIEVYKATNNNTTLVRKSNGGVSLGKPPIGGPDGPPDYVHSDIHDVRFRSDKPDTIYFATDGGVFVSLDGGETFQSVNGGYQSVQFYNGFSSSFQDSLFSLGGLQDNSTVIYDGDLAWTRRIGGDGSWTAVNSVNDNIIYGSYQFLSMLKSTNRGVSFSSISPSNQGNTVFIAPYVLSVVNPDILYAGRSRVYKSTTGGGGWIATNNNNELDGNPCLAMAISYQNSNKVYAATAPLVTRGNIFVTSNGGTSWTNITGNLPDRFPTDLTVDPSDDNAVYVTFSGFGSSHIFKSSNAGIDWIDISSGLPDVPTSAVIVDADYPGNIYVGNDLGVFVSTDAGNTWNDFNEGLPDAVIAMDLNIVYPNKKLRVATHGNGAYERDLIQKSVDVKLVSLSATIEQNNIILNWATSSEINNRGFEIERLTNGTWKKIGFVEGNGTTTRFQKYQFTDKNLFAGKYSYRLKQIDFDGSFEYSNEIESEVGFPDKLSLSQNYPNPFNPITNIQYSVGSLPDNRESIHFVQLKIYDVLGNEVATLVNEEKPAGIYEVKFNASSLASGIYYYKINAGKFTQTKKMVLLH